MQVIKYLICLFALSIVLISFFEYGVNTYPSNTYPSNGVLNWKGQDWHLGTGKSDPGNNYWNDRGAWIDYQNRMHLTVVKDEDIWKCTSLKSQHKYLYGTFTWTVASPVFTFDENSVVGLFTYLDDSQELDIEMSRWENAGGENLWYSVQPYRVKGNRHEYLVPSSIKCTNTIHKIEWKPTYVRFTSMQENGDVIADFNYTNISGIPQNPQRAMMNLWLLSPPSDGRNIELIINDFTVTGG
jgi:endo-1,3-1,4-beta-glycanase ExoK